VRPIVQAFSSSVRAESGRFGEGAATGGIRVLNDAVNQTRIAYRPFLRDMFLRYGCPIVSTEVIVQLHSYDLARRPVDGYLKWMTDRLIGYTPQVSFLDFMLQRRNAYFLLMVFFLLRYRKQRSQRTF